MTYEFQNTLHRTADEMCDAIVGAWLSAGGLNSRETMREFLTDMSDRELADECVGEWGLDERAHEEEFLGEDADGNPLPVQTWMEKRGVDRADIQDAFARLRTNFDAAFPAEAA
jgi:DNA-directed RNA polymerase specialized sigma24 family protein